MAKIQLQDFGGPSPQSYTPISNVDLNPLAKSIGEFGQVLQEKDDSFQKLTAQNELLARQQAKEQIDSGLNQQLANNEIDSKTYVETRKQAVEAYDASRVATWDTIRPDVRSEYFEPAKQQTDIQDIAPVTRTYLMKQHDEHVGALATNLSLIDNQLAKDNSIDNARASIDSLNGDFQQLFGNEAPAKLQDTVDKIFSSHVNKLSLQGEDYLLSGDLDSAKQMQAQLEQDSQRIGVLGLDAKNYYEQTAHSLASKIAGAENEKRTGNATQANFHYDRFMREAAAGVGNPQDILMYEANAGDKISQDTPENQKYIVMNSAMGASSMLNTALTKGGVEGLNEAKQALDMQYTTAGSAVDQEVRQFVQMKYDNLIAQSKYAGMPVYKSILDTKDPQQSLSEINARVKQGAIAIYSQQEVDAFHTALKDPNTSYENIVNIVNQYLPDGLDAATTKKALEYLYAGTPSINQDNTGKITVSGAANDKYDPTVQGVLAAVFDPTISDTQKQSLVASIRTGSTIEDVTYNTMVDGKPNSTIIKKNTFVDTVSKNLNIKYGLLANSKYFADHKNGGTYDAATNAIVGATNGIVAQDDFTSPQSKTSQILNWSFGKSSNDDQKHTGGEMYAKYPLIYPTDIATTDAAKKMMLANIPEKDRNAIGKVVDQLGKQSSKYFAVPDSTNPYHYTVYSVDDPYRPMQDNDGHALQLRIK